MRRVPGAKGKLAGIVNAGVLVEVDGKFITVQNRLLGRINVCVPRDLALAAGDRIHLKANRRLASGSRVANGELATVKAVRPGGAVELDDGRVLDTSYREFSAGYAVTSYGSQGKTVHYVLFSDSTVKAATNAQQWYVAISRGRRGIRIFTPGTRSSGSAWSLPRTRLLCEDIPCAGSKRPCSAWSCRTWPASPPITGASWPMGSRSYSKSPSRK